MARVRRGTLGKMWGARVAVPVVASLALVMAACGGGGGSNKTTGSNQSSTSAAPVKGGNLKVLESTAYTWHSLDPALGTGFKAFPFYMNAIYGDLFEQGANNKPIPDLASAYKVASNAMSATITLRKGVKFTDGTAFNAAAVKYNIERVLAKSSGNACACTQDFPIASIDTPNDYTLVLHLSKPFSAIIESFFNNAPNWIASPTAIQKEGAKKFAITPVGAGPFVIKSNNVGSELKLVRNPNYWAKGKPYLDSLTFSLIGSEESAYEALLTGEAQAYQNLGTPTLVAQAKTKKNLQVTENPATEPWGVKLNTTKAPFNNITAREALYYATDPQAINKSILGGNGSISQSPSGPQGLFYEPTVPGYRSYDLAKAKSLVQQLGGLSFTLLAPTSPINNQIMTALKAEWSKAGIDATLSSQALGLYIQSAIHNNWQAELAIQGNFDPAINFGVAFNFSPQALFVAPHDPTLQQLISEGVATTNQTKRATIYHQVFKRISDEAYVPMLFTIPSYNVATKGVSAPGLTTSAPEVLWEDATIHS